MFKSGFSIILWITSHVPSVPVESQTETLGSDALLCRQQKNPTKKKHNRKVCRNCSQEKKKEAL